MAEGSRRCPCTVVAMADLSDRGRLVGVETKDKSPFQFQAGQHVKVALAARPSQFSGPYSIATPPDSSARFAFLMNLVTHAVGSQYDEFKKGMDVVVEGPSGRFLFRDNPGRRSIFIAGGTGIAPLRSIIHDVIRKASERGIVLALAVRRREHLYFVHEWNRFQKANPNFIFLPILSEPDPQWRGLTGFPTQHLKLITGRPGDDDFYLCGPPEMVNGLKTELLKQGADPEHIYTEG